MASAWPWIAGVFGLAAAVGLALGGKGVAVPTGKPSKKTYGQDIKPIIVGSKDDPKVAAELDAMNVRLRARGVDTNRHDAYQLCRMRKAKKDPKGQPYCAVPIAEFQDNLGDLFAQVVQPIEDDLGYDVLVLGAFRNGGPTGYNEAVGGAPTSDHIRGRGADLDTKDVAALKLAIAKFYVRHPNMRLEFGWYAGNVHVGLGGDHETYSGSSVPGEDDKWIARAKKELQIA